MRWHTNGGGGGGRCDFALLEGCVLGLEHGDLFTESVELNPNVVGLSDFKSMDGFSLVSVLPFLLDQALHGFFITKGSVGAVALLQHLRSQGLHNILVALGGVHSHVGNAWGLDDVLVATWGGEGWVGRLGCVLARPDFITLSTVRVATTTLFEKVSLLQTEVTTKAVQIHTRFMSKLLKSRDVVKSSLFLVGFAGATRTTVLFAHTTSGVLFFFFAQFFENFAQASLNFVQNFCVRHAIIFHFQYCVG